MHKLRILYEKSGRAIYMSHLDIMRTFQRAFKRAGIDVKHTEGFNPHPYISIALPLSLGYTGECELLDIEAAGKNEEIIEKLNPALPEGVKALRAYEGGRPVREIAFSEFLIKLEYEREITKNDTDKVSDFFKSSPIVVVKRSKRGESETDISLLIKSVKASAFDGGMVLKAVLAAGSTSLNPEYLIKAMEKYLPDMAPSFFEIAHTEVYDADLNPFR